MQQLLLPEVRVCGELGVQGVAHEAAATVMRATFYRADNYAAASHESPNYQNREATGDLGNSGLRLQDAVTLADNI